MDGVGGVYSFSCVCALRAAADSGVCAKEDVVAGVAAIAAAPVSTSRAVVRRIEEVVEEKGEGELRAVVDCHCLLLRQLS